MRRSLAPSQKCNSPVPGLTSTNEELTSQQITTYSESNVRSASSLLNILKKGTSLTTVTAASLKNSKNVTQLKSTSDSKVYNVVWGKKSTKKHKTWEGDGILELKEDSAVFKDVKGNIMGRINKIKVDSFEDGHILSIGGKEVQIVELAESPLPVVCIKRSCDEQKPSPKSAAKRLKKVPSNVASFDVASVSKCNANIFPDIKTLVMPRPSADHQWKNNVNKKPIVDVSVDYFLEKLLRPHQRIGVVFLYECVMGYRQDNQFGAILADEMGLGKTLQCITLVWTLLKQGPYGGLPIIKKVLIVTPSSLSGNWQKEFEKWLGYERIRPFVVDTKNKPKDFIKVPHNPVLIISYEMFVRYFTDLNTISFDIMICDEGHRLKNNSIKASSLLLQLDCKRRIILTGTPIQNDLQEFYSLVEFVNPACFGSSAEYKKYFEQPILASREPEIDDEVKELGLERGKELSKITTHFILRRTQDILDIFLPKKTDIVLFCKPSELQQKLYIAIVNLWQNRELPNKDIPHLSIITAMKKVCNHPSLLRQTKTDEQEVNVIDSICDSLPDWSEMTPDDSGKLKILLELLKNLIVLKEKIVVVSSYTQTLDMLADICDYNQYKYSRLDGSVPSNQRMRIVDRFNSTSSSDFIFLLSAKAGGVGLNLTGASRLVLFDSDWNPAIDLQAMARVWRDGQNKSVYVYRFLTTGKKIKQTMYRHSTLHPPSSENTSLNNHCVENVK